MILHLAGTLIQSNLQVISVEYLLPGEGQEVTMSHTHTHTHARTDTQQSYH